MEEHRLKKLLDQVRDAIRLKHYSYRTEQAYVGWKRLLGGTRPQTPLSCDRGHHAQAPFRSMYPRCPRSPRPGLRVDLPRARALDDLQPNDRHKLLPGCSDRC